MNAISTTSTTSTMSTMNTMHTMNTMNTMNTINTIREFSTGNSRAKTKRNYCNEQGECVITRSKLNAMLTENKCG